MAGIISYGAYIPLYRLSRGEIAKFWGGPSLPGEKAVSNYDEDSLTMAVAAAVDCTRGFDTQKIDGVYFASTTSPYREKQVATTIAAAMGLRSDIITADFGGGLRAGTGALRAALGIVDAGGAKSILVTSADTRLGHPKGEKEMSFGDGGAALLVGNQGIVANVEGSYTSSEEFFDTWRSDGDNFVRSSEDRFRREAGYTRVVAEAVSSAFKKYSLTSGDFSKAVLYAPDPRLLRGVASSIGFDLKTQVQDPLYATVGDTGTPHSLMLLVAALEEAKTGDRLLLASYGDGCDVFILKVTKEIANVGKRRGIKQHLASKRMVPSYRKYVLWRQLMEIEPPARPPYPPLSPPALSRDRDWGLALHGSKCRGCGTPQYPAQRVCIVCQAEDEFEPYSFADKKGKVTTFSHDNLVAAVDPPTTIAVVDFEGGGRIICNMTDRETEEVYTGMPVEMSFRKLYTVEGIHNYWWKCIPIRC